MKNPPNTKILPNVSLINGYCGTMVFYPKQQASRGGEVENLDCNKDKHKGRI